MASLSSRLLQQWGMEGRVEVVEGRVEVEGAEVVMHRTDLLWCFNPFELHCDREEHRRLLRWLRDAYGVRKRGDQDVNGSGDGETVDKGQWLCSVPSMEAICERAGSDVDVGQWLQRVGECRDAVLYAVIA